MNKIWENAMQIAEQSNCLKRHVACIIVDQNGTMISTGYNFHEDGICDCETTKTALHAEIMAVNNIPEEKRNINLYAYITHRPCERCQSILDAVCQNTRYEDLSHVLPKDYIPPQVKDTLVERGHTHGDFSESALYVQHVKDLMREQLNWYELPEHQREALDMIQHKIGRILHGDYMHQDNWHDIQGYAKLVEEEL